MGLKSLLGIGSSIKAADQQLQNVQNDLKKEPAGNRAGRDAPSSIMHHPQLLQLVRSADKPVSKRSSFKQQIKTYKKSNISGEFSGHAMNSEENAIFDWTMPKFPHAATHLLKNKRLLDVKSTNVEQLDAMERALTHAQAQAAPPGFPNLMQLQARYQEILKNPEHATELKKAVQSNKFPKSTLEVLETGKGYDPDRSHAIEIALREIESIDVPNTPLRSFNVTDANSINQLSTLFKPYDYGVSVKKAPPDLRLGQWIALGVARAPETFRPKEMIHRPLSGEALKAASDSFRKLPETVRTFAEGIGGSRAYGFPYRDGEEFDRGSITKPPQDARKVLTDLNTHAVPQAEGTTVYRWMDMHDSVVKKLLDAPPGLVMQAPGPMSTSVKEGGLAKFGDHRVVIRFAEGATSLDNFGATDSAFFRSEYETLTLPGARFMVLDRNMVPDIEHGQGGTRLELELLMLPPDPTYFSSLTKKA